MGYTFPLKCSSYIKQVLLLPQTATYTGCLKVFFLILEKPISQFKLQDLNKLSFYSNSKKIPPYFEQL